MCSVLTARYSNRGGITRSCVNPTRCSSVGYDVEGSDSEQCFDLEWMAANALESSGDSLVGQSSKSGSEQFDIQLLVAVKGC